jgi:uncharacterized membrane protein YbhN (UPF0104 family)
MKPSRRTLLLLLLKAGLAATILVLLFRSRELQVDQIVAQLRAIEIATFLPWIGLAVAVKCVGIFANAWRWQFLLRGQGLVLAYPVLVRSYFVGRFFGIVTPGTLGLDGFRLYDSIRLTREPVACTAVIGIDKLVGFVSLLSVLLLVFPFGWSLLPIASPSGALWTFAGLCAAAGFALFVLLYPAWTGPLAGLLPKGRLRALAQRILAAVTAYSGRSPLLLWAVALGLVGHLTTALMYCFILRGLLADAALQPALGTMLLVALLMTCATLIVPTLGGEGVREGVFIGLLGDQLRPESAFLVGHLGFWIEKAILGLPGALIYLLRRDEYRAAAAEQYTLPSEGVD